MKPSFRGHLSLSFLWNNNMRFLTFSQEEKLKLDYMITTMLMESPLGAAVLGVKNKLNFLGLWTIFSRENMKEK